MHALRFWDVARKAGVTVLFVIGEALAVGVIPAPWDQLATAIIAVAAYFGVYATKNLPLVALRGSLAAERRAGGTTAQFDPPGTPGAAQGREEGPSLFDPEGPGGRA